MTVPIIPFQQSLRPSLPTVEGCVDYRKFRDELLRLDQILLCGLEQKFVVTATQQWLADLGPGQKVRSCAALEKYQTHSRRALRCNIVRTCLQEGYRDFAAHLADSPLLQRFCLLDEIGIIKVPAKSTVQRYLSLFGVQPHRSRSFKLSTDPFFIEKLRDIVGLYLNPPDKALVLCVDEKSQIQALERSQPVLPMGLGYVEGVTHDYYRHGTTTLFAALDVANGTVLTQCKPRHRHQEFLSFLRHIDQAVPAGLDLHLIVDNYGTHKHPNVRAWLKKHPSLHSAFCAG